MYLDDGISRDSAPKNSTLETAVGARPWYGEAHHYDGLADVQANDNYTKVQIKQVCRIHLAP